MSAVGLTRAALLAVTIGLLAPAGSEAAPLSANMAAMKATAVQDAVQVRWGGRGGWGGGRVGWGGGRVGWGYRGGWGGYRRFGAVAAGAIVGGAIARSAYYGGYGYPYG